MNPVSRKRTGFFIFLHIEATKERGTVMKKIVSFVAFLAIVFLITSADAGSVKGHWKDTNRDGVKDTYVQPHQRTNPNSSRTDNYSYPGNYNPSRGESTPQSNSPRETYPTNPNPYEQKQKRGW